MAPSKLQKRRNNLIIQMMAYAAATSESSLTQTITADWDDDTADATPDFSLTFTDPQVGDVIACQRSQNGFSSYDEATDTIDSISPVNALQFDFTPSDWSNGTYSVRFIQRRSSTDIGTSNTETVTIAAGADVTAPTLSSPVDTATGTTTGSGSVSTNEGNGTLYWVVTTSSTGPSAAQVKAGQNHLGAAATDSGSQAVSGTGVQSITGDFTGLTASTAYYAHYMHEDTATNQSAVSSGDGFTTDAISATSNFLLEGGTNQILMEGGTSLLITEGS
jgi:hypothetical protein